MLEERGTDMLLRKLRLKSDEEKEIENRRKLAGRLKWRNQKKLCELRSLFNEKSFQTMSSKLRCMKEPVN